MSTRSKWTKQTKCDGKNRSIKREGEVHLIGFHPPHRNHNINFQCIRILHISCESLHIRMHRILIATVLLQLKAEKNCKLPPVNRSEKCSSSVIRIHCELIASQRSSCHRPLDVLYMHNDGNLICCCVYVLLSCGVSETTVLIWCAWARAVNVLRRMWVIYEWDEKNRCTVVLL